MSSNVNCEPELSYIIKPTVTKYLFIFLYCNAGLRTINLRTFIKIVGQNLFHIFSTILSPISENKIVQFVIQF